MKTAGFFQRSNRGAALIIALLLIMLVSALVVFFLFMVRHDRQSVESYSQSVRVEELGMGALQEIVSDLRQEMKAGSREDRGLLIPNSGVTQMPARIGFLPDDYSSDVDLEKLPPSLLRVSRANDSFFTSPPAGYEPAQLPANRASSASSSERPKSGAPVTAEVWNKPMLLGLKVPERFAANPPDWVYVTRSGSAVCSSADIEKHKLGPDAANPDAVLGRYAFAVYDIGGLLDINVAGYSSEAANATYVDPEGGGSATVGGKTYTAYADLAALPGFPQTAVDVFVNWRSKGALIAAGEGDLGKSFLKAVTSSAGSGFSRFESGDSPLLGRQDLIDYFTALKQAGRISGLQALPYVRSFSVAVNAPSWGPETNSNEYDAYIGRDSTRVYPYRDNAFLPNAVNPCVLNVRYDSPAKIKHYRDDGTVLPYRGEDSSYSYEVKAGDPCLRHRFSLAKLAWITPTGPAEGISEEAILACFGLRWTTNGQFPRWAYNHGDRQNILTLEEVQKEQKREPDFFELLKAGILQGSLGKSGGQTTSSHNAGSPGVTGLAFSGVPWNPSGPESDPDFHILQIGANMMDQADADSYPTAIYFDVDLNGAAWSNYSNELIEYFKTAIGVENIPYLHRVWNPALVLDKTKLNAWWAFELWNPHRLPVTEPDVSKTPESFRIKAHGSCETGWVSMSKPNPPEPPVIVDYEKPEMAEARCLNFKIDSSPAAASNFFKKPRRIGFEDATTETNAPVNLASAGNGAPYGITLAGIHAGEIVRNEDMAVTLAKLGTTFWEPRTRPSIDRHLTFIVEYKGPDNRWRPASRVSRQWAFYRNSFGVSASTYGNIGRSSNARADGRTDRFSMCGAERDGWGYEATLMNKVSSFASLSRAIPMPSDGFHFSTDFSQATAAYMGLLSYNEPSRTPTMSGLQRRGFYTDPDGVVRPADGFRQDGEEGAILLPDGETRQRRPIVLDRPFRSVGELGYVFRDLPFRSIDFWTEQSADTGLLDLFSARDEPELVSGKININAASIPVLTSLLSGAARHTAEPGELPMTKQAAQDIAVRLAQELAANPIRNMAEGAVRMAAPISTSLSSADKANKIPAEATIRALSGVTDTRSWNLMIDVVAQVGQFHPAARNLNDFIVRGQRRYWLHVAIDRYTGRIIGQQMEVVND